MTNYRPVRLPTSAPSATLRDDVRADAGRSIV